MNISLSKLRTEFKHWRNHSKPSAKVPLHLKEQVLASLKYYPRQQVIETTGLSKATICLWQKADLNIHPLPAQHGKKIDFINLSPINDIDPVPPLQSNLPEIQISVGNRIKFILTGYSTEQINTLLNSLAKESK